MVTILLVRQRVIKHDIFMAIRLVLSDQVTIILVAKICKIIILYMPTMLPAFYTGYVHTGT